MSGLKLVVSDSLELGLQKAQPGTAAINLELWNLAQSQVGHIGSEGLVEPQVVPPLHGHQISEPHVGKFVQNNYHLLSLLGKSDCFISVK